MRLPLNKYSRAEGGARRFVAVIVAAAVLGVMAVVGMNANIGITQSWAAGTELIDETFSGGHVADSAFIALQDACLTGAANNSSPPAGASNLSHCGAHQSGPVPTMGAADGWLQLTDAAQNRKGGIVYNQALPATGGLVVTFDQAQYGGTAADGIVFFLTDGSVNLTEVGAYGGSLGYAQNTSTPGVAGGFIGVGLDAWGNYPRGGRSDTEDRGRGCTGSNSPGFAAASVADNYRPNVSLRGPGWQSNGQWTQGYCWLASTATNNGTQAQNWTRPWGIRDTGQNPVTAVRRVKVTVTPVSGGGNTTISVEIDPDGDGALGYELMFTHTTSGITVPSTYKFGFGSSTGGSHDVHLIRNLHVETLNSIDELTLVKTINSASPNYKASYAVGDEIPYQFVMTNSGGVALNNVQLHDPDVTGLSCAPVAGSTLPVSASMTCTGTHVVTAQDVANAVSPNFTFTNTAYASGQVVAADVFSNESSAVATLQVPRIELTKTATHNDNNNTGVVDTGDQLTYHFSVTNAGNVALSPVTITDPLLGLLNADCLATLAPGATSTCTGLDPVYTITDENVIAGEVSNTATATGTAGALGNVTDDDTYSRPTAPASASLALEKLVTVSYGHTEAEIDDVLTYTFRVHNTGTVDIFNPTITDDNIDLVNWWGSTCLTRVPVGHYIECVANAHANLYFVDNDDLRRGSIDNEAFANASAPNGMTDPAEASDTNTVPTAAPKASLRVVKSVDNGTTEAPGVPGDFTVGAEPHSNLVPQGATAIRGAGTTGQVPVLPGSWYLKDLQDGTPGMAGDFHGPAGYMKGTWSCVDTNNGNVAVVVDGANYDRIILTSDMDAICTITNTAIAGSVTWEKTDSEDAHLAGSVWTLTGPSHPSGVEIEDCVAANAALCIGPDRDPVLGQFALDGLAWGSYTLTETQAPIGYLLDLNPRAFAITGAAAETGISLGAIINHQIPPLVMPLTGGWAQDYIHMAGLALLMFALVLGAYRAHRTRKSRP